MSSAIRKATLSDLSSLSHLFDGYRVFYGMPSDLIAGKAFLRERIENGESQIFVSFDAEGTMTGFIQLYPVFSSTRMKRLWLLNDLFVHPAYRGQGISKALLYKVQEVSQETDSCGLLLETAKKNAIGNNLYPAMGFVLDEEHNYYSWDVQ